MRLTLTPEEAFVLQRALVEFADRALDRGAELLRTGASEHRLSSNSRNREIAIGLNEDIRELVQQ